MLSLSMGSVILNKGKEKILRQRHHWVFSGAIDSFPDGYVDGDLVSIKSHEGTVLGWGFFNRKCSLAGRVVSFGEEEVFHSLRDTLDKALSLRAPLLNDPQNTACRIVNGEGDGLPGLIIDKYGPYLIVQIGALGMRKLIPFFLEHLKERLSLEGVYDKSVGNSLKEEGLEPQEKVLWGEVPDRVEILENGMRFYVALKAGQKTGFFLDQREMRHWVSEISKGKRVLNAFCYTGGFTLAALKGGAAHVDSIDISGPAIELCKENVLLNGFLHQNNRFYQEDVFDFLSARSCDYDLMILDPPAFAKKRKDIPAALKGYKRLFRVAMKKIPPGGLLLLSSCSYYVNDEMFEGCVREAALEAGRYMRIIGRHRHATDHPINLFHPESHYLKSLCGIIQP